MTIDEWKYRDKQSRMFYDMQNPFFPVGVRPLSWRNNEPPFFIEPNKPEYVPTGKFVGIIDLERGYTFATATRKYKLYTNAEAADLMYEIARITLRVSNENERIVSFQLSRDRGVCKGFLRRKIETFQPLINGGWHAVLTMTNSYDKSETLKYTLGYMHDSYRMCILFPEYSYFLTTAHVIPFASFKEKVIKAVQSRPFSIGDFETQFQEKLNRLSASKLAERDMMPLFCKYFNFCQIPEQDTNDMELFLNTLSIVDQSIRKNISIYGKTAYAMLHVIMDYYSNQNCKGRHGFNDDIQLGKWVDEYLGESAKPEFSPSLYIGNKAYDVASWFDRYCR